jgi:hypothetical protein
MPSLRNRAPSPKELFYESYGCSSIRRVQVIMPGNGSIQIWMIGMSNYDMPCSLVYLETISSVETPKVLLSPPEAGLPHALQELLGLSHTLNLP